MPAAGRAPWALIAGSGPSASGPCVCQAVGEPVPVLSKISVPPSEGHAGALCHCGQHVRESLTSRVLVSLRLGRFCLDHLDDANIDCFKN